MPRRREYRRSTAIGTRVAIFVVLAAALVGAAVYVAWPREHAVTELGPRPAPSAATDPTGTGTRAPATGSDLSLRIDMSGFSPSQVRIAAGRATRVLLVNPDNPLHSDGGGIHQFAVPELGIDVKVPPQTNAVVTIPAAAPGEYAFYCDNCCGGKENPSMQGVLRIA